MANIEDYLLWRGDLTLSQSPFNNVDNLILSNLIYLIFKDIVPELKTEKTSVFNKITNLFKQDNNSLNAVSIHDAIADMNILEEGKHRIRVSKDIEMAVKLAKTKRFGSMKLMYYVDKYDEDIETQFAAITILMEDNTAYIAFRGTDTSLVGWKEDFNMSFMDKVPAQEEALKYLQAVSSLINVPLRIGGHSKGGNLAVYSALHINKNVQDRIIRIYNNDGPGFKSSILETNEYKYIKDRIDTIVPQTSIIGMLLEHEEEYIVIKSNETLIMQHDPYSWEVLGADFVKMEGTTSSSHFIDSTLREWINNMTIEQREQFVDVLWEVMGATKAKSFPEMAESLFSNAFKIGKKINQLDDKSKDVLSTALSMLINSAKNALVAGFK
ncbi:MAG: DUF2974 domain-containing protein [Mucispirillum sp.]|uniref:DUF2974 domain-containing protein n=1 Tax=Candidatus Mucispirillum faecigallinarum TaxID=2838699 RepID=A0A9D2GR66_9BACT|nr:DUF2974 domain-containing protein [Mucispirillum sp.]HIZ88548.1 DUF2974 domain-containing protein [Candidatus Mucispirillum faecigallinarum]